MFLCVSDIYVTCFGSQHCVAGQGYCVVTVSTTMADLNIDVNKADIELKPGLDLLGTVKEKYVSHVNNKKAFRTLCAFRNVILLHDNCKFCKHAKNATLVCSVSKTC